MRNSVTALYTKSLDGHRAAYLKFVKRNIGGDRFDLIQCALSRGALFFLMVEESFLLYALVASFRSLFGMRTVGLLFRPLPVLNSTALRHKIKLYTLLGLKRLRAVQTISIVPFSLKPSIRRIADDWIYDFQLWDLNEEEIGIFKSVRSGDYHGEAKELVAGILERAKGRKIILSLGVQNRQKGLEFLTKSVANSALGSEWMCVVAGKFSQGYEQHEQTLIAHGVVVLNRYMTDEEMLALYAISSAVWCVYSEDYDQASGILGRSVQLGIVPIVRQGSLSQKFCEAESIAYLSFETSDLQWRQSLESSGQQAADDLIKAMRIQSLEKLRRLLPIDAKHSGE